MVEDTIGRRTCYRYDGELLAEVEYTNPGKFHYTYTPEGCLEQATDQNGHNYVLNYYDMDGRVTRQTLSNGQEYIILYDDALRVNTFLTPSNGSRREYHYNKDELLVKTVYTDGTAEVLATTGTGTKTKRRWTERDTPVPTMTETISGLYTGTMRSAG